MLTLAAGDTLNAVASAASQVTSTVHGMELNGTTEVYKVLDQRQLAAAAATIYTVPASTTAFIRSIHVVNSDTVSRTFQYFRGGVAAANAITPVITLPLGGMAVYEDGQGWTLYNASGQILANPQVLGTNTPNTVDAAAGTPGTSVAASAQDHDHQLSVATNAILFGTAAAAGAANTTLRSNDTIAAFDATAPTTSAVGDAAAVGSIAFAARRDHLHGREAFVTNTIVLGTAAAAGAATTHIRPDATIAAFDATVPAVTTPLLASTAGAIAFAARRDHTHRSPGGISSIVAPVTITNTTTETVVTNASMAAGFMAAGTTFRIRATGIVSSAAAAGGGGTWNCRIGTTTLTGNIAGGVTIATFSGALINVGFDLDFLVTVRTAGAGGTVLANGHVIGILTGVTAALTYAPTAITATVAVDTTAAKLIELTYAFSVANASNSITFTNASIEVVKM